MIARLLRRSLVQSAWSRRASFVLAGALLASPAARASGPQTGACAEALAARVQSRYESVRDLRARFEQRTRRVSLGHGESRALLGRGTVVFAKPGRMRWTYEAPEPSVVVSDGESLWIYDPVAGEAQHLTLGAGFLSGAAIQFLLGRGNLLREFKVSSGPCEEVPTRLVLSPREDAPYERLEVRADPKTGEISETLVADLLGNVTRVQFQEVRTNSDPDPSLFRFDPPEGVRVLELPRSQ